jgi:hypothetical protein
VRFGLRNQVADRLLDEVDVEIQLVAAAQSAGSPLCGRYRLARAEDEGEIGGPTRAQIDPSVE